MKTSLTSTFHHRYLPLAIALLTASCLGGWAVNNSQAGTISFAANIEFSVATPPAGASPWLTATFDDGGGSGSVVLTLTATNLTGTEFVSEWDINLDPSLNVANLVFSSPTKTGSFDDPTISKGTNAFKADGDGKYDVNFDFATGGGASSRFGVGESVQYTITGIPTLTANSFNFDSAPDGGHGPFRMAAHVQSIGASGSNSGWVAPDPVEFGPLAPEPTTLSLGLVAAVGVLLTARRRVRR